MSDEKKEAESGQPATSEVKPSEAIKPADGAAAKPADGAVTAAKPALPPKPAPAKPAAKTEDRRGFLSAVTWFSVAWVAMGAALTGMLLGTVRFLFPNVLSEPPSRIKVGFPGDFEEGKVVERFKDQNTWIVRYQGNLFALSTTCTHLGCTPNWLEQANKFKCPCHGSGFYITGINFEGPAPRPLERWGISIGEDGQVLVDKAKKFQQELGQWDNPESFIKV
jgi:cytochrome b6-f complex iron-sulfur subunit